MKLAYDTNARATVDVLVSRRKTNIYYLQAEAVCVYCLTLAFPYADTTAPRHSSQPSLQNQGEP